MKSSCPFSTQVHPVKWARLALAVHEVVLARRVPWAHLELQVLPAPPAAMAVLASLVLLANRVHEVVLALAVKLALLAQTELMAKPVQLVIPVQMGRKVLLDLKVLRGLVVFLVNPVKMVLPDALASLALLVNRVPEVLL